MQLDRTALIAGSVFLAGLAVAGAILVQGWADPGFAALAATLGTAWALLHLLVLRPLDQITAVLAAIAAGQPPPGATRPVLPQLVRLAATLDALDAAHAQDSTDQVSVITTAQQADQARLDALRGMAEAIRRESQDALNKVVERGQRVQGLFGEMEDSAAQTEAEAARVADAATASGRASSVAAGAATELAAAMQEVTSQIARSAAVTRTAVEATQRASAVIDSLAGSVGGIADISRLIGDVARRTNMLALNATIEAARAGEAGKGFAVVAGEVKALASQTAQSTGEIDARISAIRASSGEAASAMAGIVEAIGEIDAISASIAASVEQQTAATGEIARAIESVSSSAQDVADRIDTVNMLAASAGGNINTLSAESHVMREKIEELRDSLITIINVAVNDAERRREPRLQADLPVRLLLDDGEEPGRLEDISAGGAAVLMDNPRMVVGAVRLMLEGLPAPATARVVHQKQGRLRLEFAEPGLGRPVLEKVASARAARAA